jgi:hypothetical protein
MREANSGRLRLSTLKYTFLHCELQSSSWVPATWHTPAGLLADMRIAFTNAGMDCVCRLYQMLRLMCSALWTASWIV